MTWHLGAFGPDLSRAGHAAVGDALLRGKGTYTAVYSREADGAWIVYIRGHRHEIHSFARSLRRARENIRDALSLWYDDAATATIVDRVELEGALKEELAETEELARLHSDVSQKLRAKRRRTVKALQRSGMGTRDIADLLELSQQRVSQIARGTR